MLNILVRYPWPGNVRELENAMERAVVLSRGDTLNEELLPTAIRAFAQQGRANMASEGIDTLSRRLAEQSINEFELREGQIYDMVIRQVEKSLIEKALLRCGGVKIKAADFLGINRNTLNKKFKELGLEAEEADAPVTPPGGGGAAVRGAALRLGGFHDGPPRAGARGYFKAALRASGFRV